MRKDLVFLSVGMNGFLLMSYHLCAGYREQLQQREFGGMAGGMGLVEEELRERIRRKDREMAEQLDRMEVRYYNSLLSVWVFFLLHVTTGTAWREGRI